MNQLFSDFNYDRQICNLRNVSLLKFDQNISDFLSGEAKKKGFSESETEAAYERMLKFRKILKQEADERKQRRRQDYLELLIVLDFCLVAVSFWLARNNKDLL